MLPAPLSPAEGEKKKKKDTANISLKIPRTKNKNKQQLAVVSALIMPVGVLNFFFLLLLAFQCYSISGLQRCSTSAADNCLHVTYIKAGLTRINTPQAAAAHDCQKTIKERKGGSSSERLLNGRCAASSHFL